MRNFGALHIAVLLDEQPFRTENQAARRILSTSCQSCFGSGPKLKLLLLTILDPGADGMTKHSASAGHVSAERRWVGPHPSRGAFLSSHRLLQSRAKVVHVSSR
jgi:hypothetical protein